MNWYDQEKRLISNAKYKSTLMEDGKRFSAQSTIVVNPKKSMHNWTYTCEVWNEAQMHARHARARIEVKYPPSVSIVPLKPAVPKEGEKVGYQCMASANPPPYADKYQWYLDDRPAQGQFGFYFEVSNVTRKYQNRQLKCSVQNDLGKADGVTTIEVQCKCLLFLFLSNKA